MSQMKLTMLVAMLSSCFLVGCASKELTQFQKSESKALSEKQEADKQVEKAGNELEDADRADKIAKQNLQQKIKLQIQADDKLKSLLSEKDWR